MWSPSMWTPRFRGHSEVRTDEGGAGAIEMAIGEEDGRRVTAPTLAEPEAGACHDEADPGAEEQVRSGHAVVDLAYRAGSARRRRPRSARARPAGLRLDFVRRVKAARPGSPRSTRGRRGGRRGSGGPRRIRCRASRARSAASGALVGLRRLDGILDEDALFPPEVVDHEVLRDGPDLGREGGQPVLARARALAERSGEHVVQAVLEVELGPDAVESTRAPAAVEREPASRP